MRKHILTLMLVMLTVVTFGQQWVAIKSDVPSTIQTTLVSSSERQITINLQVPGFYTQEVTTPRGEANLILVPRTVSTAAAGEPNLPMIAIPAIVGDRQHYNIRVVDAQYTDFPMEVAPSKGDFPRTINPADVPYTYGEAYSTDAFFPTQNVGLYEPYILRDFRGQNMVVYPFAYNPVSKTLRVYYNMTVEMFSDGLSNENVLDRRSNEVRLDPEIQAMYENHFINYNEGLAKYTPVVETGHLLIICHDAFMSAMQPFVNWKKQIGRPTTMVGTSTAGTSATAIKAYIQDQYDANSNLTHVLLVGDVAQIPGNQYSAGSYGGKSDNIYGQVAGNDYYNDIIVGRFSAENEAHVTTQVNKVIFYERDINATATWLTYGMGIGNNDGPGHFGEKDWQHIENIRTDLLGYHYTTVYQEYPGVSGYSSSSSIMSQHINGGLSIIDYCNHGSETSWALNNYSNSNVNALSNVNMLPIVWSVACLNGKYDHSQPCFGETWLRATNGTVNSPDPTQPTGAIGGMFSYISQPWQPPMYGQDEMVDVLVESYSNNIKRTLGGCSYDGNMKILDQYGQNANDAKGTYLAWILYGDPTLTLRNDIPANMNVTHAPSMTTSATSFTVNATNGNGALATLTRNNEIMGSATIVNGTCNITFAAPGTPGTATLTVFGYNKITYIATINITQGSGPDPISMNVTANPTLIAQGGTSQLNAIATGGNGTFTYSWTPAVGLNNPSIQNPVATPNTTTTYTCTVSSGGLTASGTCTVTVVSAPTNLTANVQNNSNVVLNWTAANPAQSYKVYRDGTMIAENITATTYTDSNLSAGTYSYQVSTVYQGIESPRSNTATANINAALSVMATAFPNTIPFGNSSTLNANATGGNNSYTYSWSPAATLNNPNIQSPTATPTETTLYTVTVTSNGQTATAQVTVNVVTAPTNLKVNFVPTKGEAVSITWDAPALADSYKLYRNGELLAAGIIDTHYVDENLEDGDYCYTVTALYRFTESPESNEDCIELFSCRPATNLSVEYYWENEEHFGALLSWDKDENTQPNLTKFNIYRGLDPDNLELIATVEYDPELSHFEYLDEDVEIEEYLYQIGSYYEDHNGDECFSEMASVTITNVMENEASVKVYPNPTQGEVTLEGEGLSHIRIMNAYGQTVYNAEVEGEQVRIDLSQMAKGIYMMHIEAEGGQAVRKIVVE